MDEPVETLLKTDSGSRKQRLSVQLPSSIHEELHDIAGVQILKAKGRELQLEVDTSRSPLEPIIAAIMQRCHILDMTITDPPMEEIIAAIYSEQRQEEAVREVHTAEHDNDTTMALVSPASSQEAEKPVQDTTTHENTTSEEETMLYSAANINQLQEETAA